MSIDVQKINVILKEAAQSAAQIHRRYFNNIHLATDHKANQSYNQVTQADLDAEEAIVRVIKQHYPDHNILGEENQYSQTESPYTWIVDPLDGTNNFAAGIPMFSVSIALRYEDEIVAGVVYDVARDEMFVATKGGGATLNDKRIQVNRAATLQHAMLITGFYYDRGDAMRLNLDKIQQFFERDIIGVRRFGSAALDLCYVACGRVAGFWEFKLHPWDFAAGALIVQEAGGQVTDLQGAALPYDQTAYVVSSNGAIHTAMLEVLQSS